MKLNVSTFRSGVSQHLGDLLVGWVLSQGAHDVSDLDVGNLAVTNPVEQTKGLPVVCREERTSSPLIFTN